MTTETETRAAAHRPSRELAIDSGWRSWDGVHGGHLAGLLAAHARTALPAPAPLRALHASLLTAVRSEHVTVDAELLRAGRSVATVRAALTTGGRTAVTATATFGHDGPGPDSPGEAPPPVPAADTRAPLPSAALPPFAQHVEIRPADGRVPFGGGDEPSLTAWLRPRTPLDDTAHAVLILLDALAPALYAVLPEPVPIPTVELAAHLTPAAHRHNPSGWVLARIRTDHAADGWCVDDCALWTPDGTLLVTGRQTRRVLTG